MSGTKTNERPGTRAQVRYVRTSAYKVREVLNLIRGLDVASAEDILMFTDRGAADVVLKALRSAVANAGNNDDIPPEELFVASCYADEGPTLKRWRPRARGRATRIRKRTCHITIIVARLEGEDLDRLREKQASSYTARGARPQEDSGEARRRRVAASKQSDDAEEATGDDADETEETVASADAGTDETTTEEATEEVVDEAPADDADAPASDDVDSDEEDD
jgi:large subunit ribosomal protein L22